MGAKAQRTARTTGQLVSSFGLGSRLQGVQKVMGKNNVVALQVVHGSSHAGKAFAEAQVIGRVVLGRLTLGPVPMAAVLQIHDVNLLSTHDGAAVLQPQIVHATDALLKALRSHDRRADGKNNAIIQPFDRAPEEAEIHLRGSANGRAVEHRMIRDDVIPDAGMDREWHAVTKSTSEDRELFPGMAHLPASAL